MSKTDKTKPWWCQVTKWVPHHSYMCRIKGCTLPTHYPRNSNEARIRWGMCYWKPADWNEITWPRNSEWYLDAQRNRSRGKREWRKDWGVA